MRLIKLMLTISILISSSLVLAQHPSTPESPKDIQLGETISTRVDGGMSYGEKLYCRAYLYRSAKQNNKSQASPTLLFSQLGTGAYSTYSNHNSVISDYELHIDKPGITVNLDDKKSETLIIDKKIFDLYTINTLISCAENALDWADNALGKGPKKIILYGYSEGSAVMSQLAYKILSNNQKKALQTEIKALFLSGVVMDSMANLVKKQLSKSDYDTLLQNHENHNGQYFFDRYGVGWGWIDNALKSTTPLSDTFDKLGKLPQGRMLPIEFFQGIFDGTTATDNVYQYEKKNSAASEDAKLNLHSRYYNSAHNIHPTATSDMELMQKNYFGY